MNSYETSWADQWDSDPPASDATARHRGSGSGKAKYGKKVEGGLVKTKAAAVTGMKKVKDGACVGFNWIKDKYHHRKDTQKH
ncbi:hypothetical protein Nepgr_023298 [Nepenthes gracilis]|uniref:Uncharacterized protein n=1 Tax=Nepenthes gracilis TaxID=150966 RepID=A0AAD3T422_NEPGR|nr:hypothetical protein Nepgr_023298 [Nepenthes gracilis]